MRTIKFRAWDKSDSRMLPVTEPEEQGKREYYPFEVAIGFSHWKKEDIILMQWTGLQDKNGNEIYEGDILKTPCAALKDQFNYTYVEYRNDIAAYVKRTSDTRAYTRLEIRIGEVEVIGNIYENPELLKQ